MGKPVAFYILAYFHKYMNGRNKQKYTYGIIQYFHKYKYNCHTEGGVW